jgi:hypothetical protein
MNVKKLLSVAALFGSMTTLVCCVLPAVLVALGFGATFASFIGFFPQITWLSEHKGIVFGGAAVLLIVAGVVHRRQVCTLEGCETLKGWSQKLLILSLVLYFVGFTFAFLL